MGRQLVFSNDKSSPAQLAVAEPLERESPGASPASTGDKSETKNGCGGNGETRIDHENHLKLL